MSEIQDNTSSNDIKEPLIANLKLHDQEEFYKKKSFIGKASCCSKLMFSWGFPIVRVSFLYKS